jgi:hypothetical protein
MTDPEFKPLHDLSSRVAKLATEDAGHVILAVALIQQLLETMLLAHLPKVLPAYEAKLFGSALGSFTARIKFARALGLIDDNCYQDLKGIWRVRCAFAHPHGFLHFKDKEVEQVFKQVKWPSTSDPKGVFDERIKRSAAAIEESYDALLYAYASKEGG